MAERKKEPLSAGAVPNKFDFMHVILSLLQPIADCGRPSQGLQFIDGCVKGLS